MWRGQTAKSAAGWSAQRRRGQVGVEWAGMEGTGEFNYKVRTQVFKMTYEHQCQKKVYLIDPYYGTGTPKRDVEKMKVRW